VRRDNVLKELLKKATWVIRVLLWATVLHYVNILFVLVPYRNTELMEVFNEQMTVIKERCEPHKYRNPNFFTTVMFRDLKEEIAYCQHKVNGFVLVFDKGYWDYILSKSDKKQVMMHEIVHCVFKQEHVEDPNHFMAPYFEPMTDAVFDQQVKLYLLSKCSD